MSMGNMEQKPSTIKSMFDSIAPSYDFLNRFLSLRRDVYWRKKLVASLAHNGSPPSSLLDVACGTCDVSIEAIRQYGPGLQVWGADFSWPMLKAGKNKISTAPGLSAINLVAADALLLPFHEEMFDAITIAFGIRNIADKPAALESFKKHLKSGGILAVLELTTPEKGLPKKIYLAYFKRILPVIGWIFSKNLAAYQYLPDSVLEFPTPEKFAEMMEHAGFARVTWEPLTLGIATLFIGQKK